MDIEFSILAPMIVLIVLIVTVGGVILLKPLANRLGHLLEAMAREKENPGLENEVRRMHDLLESMDSRLALLEERQDFTDRLLSESDGDRGGRRLRRPLDDDSTES